MNDRPQSILDLAIPKLRNLLGKTRKVILKDRSGNEIKIKFTFIEFVGRGTFGVVTLIESSQHLNRMALKTTYKDNKYKNRELEILLKLDHPNIISLKYYFSTLITPKGCFLNLVFDHFPISLEDYIEETPYNPVIVLKLYTQALSALNYLHCMNICHRDLKPANIMLDLNLNLKIIDFGCAKKIVEGETNLSYICSRVYRAPENLLNQSNYNCKIDIWSLGLVFYEFKSKKPVFNGNSSDEMINLIYNFINRKNFKDFLVDYMENNIIGNIIYESLKINPEKRISAYELCKKYLNL